jgi:catechol 2,3-dioxygenase-like lactoylglutathione lyase family enzyme
MKISNLVFWVQDATLSVKFYKKVGFEIRSVTDRDATVSAGGFDIVLVTMRDEDDFARDALAASKGRGMYVYVAVADVDATYARLVAKGVAPISEPRDWEWGNREFVVKDPDGYKLCFWQRVRD